MITDWLAKQLYPRWQPYRRRRQVRAILVALFVGLLVAGTVTGILILMNSTGQ